MIVSDVLTLMTTFDNENDLTAGGTDESRALASLNAAKLYIETVAASMPRVLSSRGTETIKTAANVESTPIPLKLLRIDRLWMLDSTTLLPLYPMSPLFEVGGQSPSVPWLVNFTNISSPGRPTMYYPDGEALYFDPIPDVQYQLRAYGMWARELFVDRDSAFLYPDSLALSFAAFAIKYMKMSVDDQADQAEKLATQIFTPALRSLRRRDRSEATPRAYKYDHST